MRAFVKRRAGAPPGLFDFEAAGLQWLSAATGGVPCVRVLDHADDRITLEHLETTGPTRSAAYEFGQRLAVTHDAGADGFGAPPDGWSGPGYFGPLHRPLPMSLTSHATWGWFYARERLRPNASRAATELDASTRAAVDAVIARCEAGDFDDDDSPARLHGDLWSGNVMWTSSGVVLIDPAAYGGHRETDLAMLALFGCPFFDAVIDGYLSRRPLREGWRQRAALHQLYPLLAHVVIFGAGYERQVAQAAGRTLEL
ncbi:fructosamine kinase family protein [Mycolicibacterium pulveris]|uniref:Fructosamine kinase n=1 Tax=Mycolicibacterium pulveris TaxID=36813 RepID=A0A7I7UI46_MYCPV|nr:fructosamine kinase family protein [Mycolicibacterium pulveris]MCV6979559.1 fructosamine kinase family protein [Mycolicibacterium pulveris]BBY80995.1 fructosamine kinase [Mycolicibacterium pulveris]